MHEERFIKASTYNFKTFKMFNEFVVMLIFMPQIMLPRSKYFCPVCHSVIQSFRKFVWNFNLANNFSTVKARALIFHLSVSSAKTFPWVPSILTL